MKKGVRQTACCTAAVMLGVYMLGGCASTVDTPSETDGETQTSEAETENTLGYDIDESYVQIDVDLDKQYQTWQGWGAGFTWYADWLVRNVNAEEAYDLLFSDLRLTTLRFRNTYMYDTLENDFTTEKKIYDAAVERAAENGQEITVLLTSWSPAAYLKSTGEIEGESTLAKDEDGNYMYEELGEYFADAIEEYAAWDIPIDVLSIQNELEFSVEYDCCLYDYEETDELACYADAFLATYDALQARFGEEAPKMIGPESMTIDDFMISEYVKKILETKPEALYGIAHHLYAGGNYENPGSYREPMTAVNEAFPDLHKWQTEFYEGNAMQTAEIIMRSLINENVDCYLYWDGVWSMDSGLIGFEYSSTNDYLIHENYYAFKMYSRFIQPGYVRVNSFLSGDSTYKMLNCTFISEDKTKLATVILNPTDEDVTVQINIPGFEVTDSTVYLSCCQEGYNLGYDYMENLCQEAGSLAEDHTYTIPANSFITVDMTGTVK